MDRRIKERTGALKASVLTDGILLMLIGILLCGCGKTENMADIGAQENTASEESSTAQANTAAEENSTVQENTASENIVYTEPPLLELCGVSDAIDSAALRSCGYTWTYLETDERAVAMLADSPDVLMENAPWKTLSLPEESCTPSHTVSVAKLPDELGITVWDIADTGKLREKCTPIETYRYSGEKMKAEDFCVSLQPGRIYDIYMKWNEERLMENRFSGTAYYVVRTDGEPLTGKGNEKGSDILLSIDDSYHMTAMKEEDGEKVQEDSVSDTSGFSDVLIKYTNLDIAKDENQYTDDSVIYCLQIFDSEGQLMQTIEYMGYKGDYLCIDKVRYRDKGAGTTRELFLAIDNLFPENFPTASFGAADDGEVDHIEEVTMEAAYVTPKGIHLVFTNHTDKEYMFGDDYELYAWQDGEWRKADYIIDNAAFNAIGYMLSADSSAGWDVKWTYFHGILPDGQYRITKTVSEEESGKDKAHYRLAAEFTVFTGM